MPSRYGTRRLLRKKRLARVTHSFNEKRTGEYILDDVGRARESMLIHLLTFSAQVFQMAVAHQFFALFIPEAEGE